MAAANRIPPAKTQSKAIPLAKASSDAKKWTFGFQFWTQMEYFGLDHTKVDVKWFISLLERLKDLSREKIENIFQDSVMSDALRFHPIRWDQKNIPITKEEFDQLVPSKLISEDTDVCQFMLSKATGRIVGFFDHEQTFQIVLLDPAHNIQPSKYNGYALTPTKIVLSETEAQKQALILLKKRVDERCIGESCDMRSAVSEALGAPVGNRFFCLNDYFPEDKLTALAQRYGTIEEIVFEAMLQLDSMS